MRILQVSDYYPDYGAGIVETIARRLALWGHDVLVLAGSVDQLGRYLPRGWQTLAPRLKLLRFAAAGIRGAGTSFSIPIPSLPSLVGSMRMFKPDVANLHFAPHLGNFLLAPFLKMQKVPILFTLHGVSTGYSSIALRVSSTLINRLSWLPIGLASQVIVVDDQIRHLAESTYLVEPEKLCVIRNGIDAQRFRPANQKATTSVIRVGYCGRLSAAKNVECVIRAIQLVKEQYGLPVIGMIAGDGPARRNLESLALELSAPVIFLGHLSNEEVVRFYQEIDCLAHPSTVEGLPQSVLEAMSCEVPVLVSSAGGLADLVVDKFNGLVLRSTTADEVAAAIVALSRDEQLRRKISMNGRLTVLRSHSDILMCSRYLQVYQDAYRNSR